MNKETKTKKEKKKKVFNVKLLYRRTCLIIYDIISVIAASYLALLMRYSFNISEIPAVGEEFDPNIHNAVMHIDDDSVTDNTVVEEFMKGYMYNNERVVRHSMVKVAN